jgi:hypothetical protein
MPINIIDYSNAKEGDKGHALEWLCDDEWEMPTQIEALENWLIENQDKLSKGSYVADIGFSPRPGAAGGGAVLTKQTMEIMVSIGMELCLSEYPEFVDE